MRHAFKIAILAMAISLIPFYGLGEEVYFSPNGGIAERIISEINSAEKSLDIMMYSFSSAQLAKTIVEAKARKVKVRILLDKLQSSGKYSKAPFLIQNGIPIIIEQQKGIMHNKVLIVDDEIVITGSYNWTNNAEDNNEENIVIIDDAETVNKYKERFEYLWKLNKGGKI